MRWSHPTLRIFSGNNGALDITIGGRLKIIAVRYYSFETGAWIVQSQEVQENYLPWSKVEAELRRLRIQVIVT